MTNDTAPRNTPIYNEEEEDTSDPPTMIVPVKQYRKENDREGEEDPFGWFF